MAQKISFLTPDRDPFATTLRQRVDAYFQQNGLSRHANGYFWWKAAFFLGAYFGIYAAILSGRFSEPVMLALCLALGFTVACIGFNVGHDACHNAVSDKPWMNRLFMHSFTVMGANVYNWNISHNIVHHSYTNIPEADGDLHPMPFLRFYPKEGKKPVHRYQHWYAFFLYSLTSLAWVFPKDFRHFFERKLIAYDKPEPPASEYVWLFAGKAAYYFAFLVLPAIVLDLPWWKVLIGFTAMHLVAGFLLATVFQLGHLVEGTRLVPLGDGKIPASWLAHQVETSANFATRNPLALFCTGGLNFQIEHHLFPRISHAHYPALAKIVKETAAEYGVHYTEYPSFGAALASHRRVLKAMGVADELPSASAQPAAA